ncbi:MAG: T9SS type A sorting domain-containing protein, partial [Bacteroidetes bacterium]|nr:T9SS type A sorting domain-containing protein [Bacteroidota bacterium]
DQVSYSIYGVSLKGAETLIQSGVIGQLDLSFIDPAQYPLLRVVMNMKDDVNLTAVQLKKWFILYESVADGLLFYQGPLTTQTVQEGQSFTGQYGFTNISSKSFADSLQVFAETNTVAKAYRQTSSFKIKAPAPGDTTKFSVTIHSQGKSGFNDVNVFVNPKIQPEQYYENNAIDLAGYLDVLTDVSKPLLDVTVDRRYLKNGDFVSSSPAIQIKLHDDNRFLFISDTTHINAFLSYPCDLTPCPYERINFSRSDVQWSSSSTGSDFTFNFNPTNLPQGLYALQVNGSDASGNMSGIDPYEVTFQIKNETALTLKAVYPNPSNDIFNFSFVLSGNELPHDFSLQIFSLDGQLVQQFGSNDVSTFIVGTNELHWSTAGANMPNGLFAYRLTIKVNEKTVSQSGKLMLIK